MHYLLLEKRERREEQEELVDDLILALNPERWKQIHKMPDGVDPRPVTLDGLPTEEVDVSREDVDAYFENRGQKRIVSGGDLAFEGEWV